MSERAVSLVKVTQPSDPSRPDPLSKPGIDYTKPGPQGSQGSSAGQPPPAYPPPSYPPPSYPPPSYPPPPPGYPHQPPGSQLSPNEERTWAGAAHWSALVASLLALSFLGPLLVLLVKGNQSPLVRRQAVESLNFQLTIYIAGLVSFVLVFVLIGIPMLLTVGVLWLVFTVIGAVKASTGEDYRYPLNLRMVR